MDNENKKVKKYLSSSMTVRSVSILLIFSSIVTILAFAVAYNEHRKITVLSQKYEEAIVKINNCEEALNALINQTEHTSSDEPSTVTQPEETDTTAAEEATPHTEATTHTEVTTSSKSLPSTTSKQPVSTTEKLTEKTTAPTTDKPEKTTAASSDTNTSATYFVTQSGTKYHVGTCSYLSKSKIPITMDRIKSGGYSPCSRCIK